MKDAFGGVMNIMLITAFLVIVSGILGFIVCYSKAFRMKNIVISNIERYEGSASCFNLSSNSACSNRIMQFAKSIGYSPGNLNCNVTTEDGLQYTKVEYEDGVGVFCYVKKNGTNQDKNHTIYSVITQVDIDIPIIDKIMGMHFFQIKGDTRVINR